MCIIPGSIPEITVTADDLRENKKDFTFEISEKESYMGQFSSLSVVYLKSAKTGDRKLFKCYKTDISGGDVAGWRYRAEDGTELLIIND
jgi:hypothetical protein